MFTLWDVLKEAFKKGLSTEATVMAQQIQRILSLK